MVSGPLDFSDDEDRTRSCDPSLESPEDFVDFVPFAGSWQETTRPGEAVVSLDEQGMPTSVLYDALGCDPRMFPRIAGEHTGSTFSGLSRYYEESHTLSIDVWDASTDHGTIGVDFTVERIRTDAVGNVDNSRQISYAVDPDQLDRLWVFRPQDGYNLADAYGWVQLERMD